MKQTLESVVETARESLERLEAELAGLGVGDPGDLPGAFVLRERADQLPLEILGAKIRLSRAELAVVEADRAVLLPEREERRLLIPQREAELEAAKRALLAARNAHYQVDNRLGNLNREERRLRDELATLETEFRGEAGSRVVRRVPQPTPVSAR